MQTNQTFDTLFLTSAKAPITLPLGDKRKAAKFRFQLYTYRRQVQRTYPAGEVAQAMSKVEIAVLDTGDLQLRPKGWEDELEQAARKALEACGVGVEEATISLPQGQAEEDLLSMSPEERLKAYMQEE